MSPAIATRHARSTPAACCAAIARWKARLKRRGAANGTSVSRPGARSLAAPWPLGSASACSRSYAQRVARAAANGEARRGQGCGEVCGEGCGEGDGEGDGEGCGEGCGGGCGLWRG
eukprot:4434721-Prymnesium_polylepis.1